MWRTIDGTVDGLSYGAKCWRESGPQRPSRENVERNIREAVWEEARGNHEAATFYLEWAVEEERNLRG
tara:strand:- start:1726 stop:1929 length:204 start_codon:yes stop_codon:yes gene_type:complete